MSQGREPSLRAIIVHYYASSGIPILKSQKLADEYIDALLAAQAPKDATDKKDADRWKPPSRESVDSTSDLSEPGMRVIWQSEIDLYARAILRKHWPAIPNLGDIRGIRLHVKDGLWPTPTTDTKALADGQLQAGRQGAGYERPAILYGGFPAKISATQGSGPASTASGQDYGQSSPELLASYDPATRSWRTSQLCLDGDLDEFSETWPRSGMTRNGIAYRLPPLVRLTDATVLGLLPTPMTVRAHDSGQHGRAVLPEQESARLSGGSASAPMADANQPRLQGRLRESLRQRADQRIGLGRVVHVNTPRTTPPWLQRWNWME